MMEEFEKWLDKKSYSQAEERIAETAWKAAKESDKEPKLCICCEEITEENAHLHRNCGK